jgi:hypothetical protein
MPYWLNHKVYHHNIITSSHDILKQWQDRYFVLDANKKRLTYYVDKSKEHMKGEYELSEKSSILEGR